MIGLTHPVILLMVGVLAAGCAGWLAPSVRVLGMVWMTLLANILITSAMKVLA